MERFINDEVIKSNIMTASYRHRYLSDVKLKDGKLELPSSVSRLYPDSIVYSLDKCAFDGYNFLFIFPKRQLTRGEMPKDSIVSLVCESEDLGVVINSDGNPKIELPVSFLHHIGLLRNDSWVRVLVNLNGQIIAWNPQNFKWQYAARGNPPEQ